MPRKIILFIVEGPSDKTALELILTRLCSSQKISFHVMHDDITTRKGIKPDNIIKNVGNTVRFWADNNHYIVDDFKEVIHLVDLDGTYVDDKLIVEDEDAQKVLYSENEIRCMNPEDIRKRNQNKGDNIYRLCCTGKVWNTIPYHVYYMSANLDHVLYNKLNSTDEEKENDANEFSKQYKDNLNDFLKFMCDSEFSVKSDYKSSWKFIREENRSLQRHTNFSIWLEKSNIKRDTDQK